MLWQYITNRYQAGEPIIASDIELDISEVYRRQQFKQLTDNGKLKRYENGVYYIPTSLLHIRYNIVGRSIDFDCY